MRKVLIATVASAGLFAGTQTQAAIQVNESFEYDGSYAPDSVTPPAGMSTWTVGGNISVQPNTGRSGAQAGVAYLNDNGNGLVSIVQNFSDVAFLADASDYTWQFDIRLSWTVDTGVNHYNMFGVRSEGDNGLMVALAPDRNGGLYLLKATNEALVHLYEADVDGPALDDGVLRTFTLAKWFDGTNMKVSAYMDGQLLGTVDYNDTNFPAGNPQFGSVGIWTGSSSTTSDFVIDHMSFGAVTIPEPASVALLGLGGLLVLRRRK